MIFITSPIIIMLPSPTMTPPAPINVKRPPTITETAMDKLRLSFLVARACIESSCGR